VLVAIIRAQIQQVVQSVQLVLSLEPVLCPHRVYRVNRAYQVTILQVALKTAHHVLLDTRALILRRCQGSATPVTTAFKDR
jgi:hypothetical protein